MLTPELDRALEWARRGDPEGFRQIYQTLSPVVTRVLWVLNPLDAEDLAAETWMAVARDLSKFQGDASGLRPWVLAIARNRHRDLCRKAQRRPLSTPLRPAFDPPSAAEDDPAARLSLSAATAEVLALIRRLPDKQAEVIILRVLAGMDVAEVASATGQRPGTVRVLAHRGLRTLASYLEGSHSDATQNFFRTRNAMAELDALRSS